MKCLRCGEENKKRLVALREWNILTWKETEFYVCKDRLACRARQLRARPAKMKVNESEVIALRVRELRQELHEKGKNLPNGI